MANNVYEKTPRRICHDNYPKNAPFGRIPTYAIAPINRHLTDGERRLFTYYALQADGFAPSFYEIYKNTGLVESNSSRMRKRLADKGFIFFTIDRDGGDSSIHIRWDHIREIEQEIIQKDLVKKGVGVAATPITNKVLDEELHEPPHVGDNPIARSKPRRRRRSVLNKSEKFLLKWYQDLSASEAKDVCDVWQKTEQLPF